MSLADFWNNITTPGFVSSSYDEIKEMWKDIKAEARGWVEEGEELFTDGFKEMVLKDNNDYKTSIEKIADGDDEIKIIKKQLLEARGITDSNRHVIDVLCDEFSLLIEAITRFEKSEIESVCKELQEEFPAIIFKLPNELVGLLRNAAILIEVPKPPSYVPPPPSEKIKEIGPIRVSTSAKQKRVRSADKYLEEIGVYKKRMELEIDKQKKSELLFDTTVISSAGEKLIDHFGSSYWKVRAMSGGVPSDFYQFLLLNKFSFHLNLLNYSYS